MRPRQDKDMLSFSKQQREGAFCHVDGWCRKKKGDKHGSRCDRACHITKPWLMICSRGSPTGADIRTRAGTETRGAGFVSVFSGPDRLKMHPNLKFLWLWRMVQYTYSIIDCWKWKWRCKLRWVSVLVPEYSDSHSEKKKLEEIYFMS
jgi:hypothetical protein